MTPKYLNTEAEPLIRQRICDKLEVVVKTNLLRNAHYIRHNSGLVVDGILRLHYKSEEYHPLLARVYQTLASIPRRDGS